MVVGIGFIGVFTATITSFFVNADDVTEKQQDIEQRLSRIEEKLDASVSATGLGPKA